MKEAVTPQGRTFGDDWVMKGRERECGKEAGGRKEESDSLRWRFSNLKGIQIIQVLVKM